MKNIKWLISKDGLPFTYVVFYCVGLALFSFSLTQSLFIAITPFSLVLASFSVFYYHKEWNVKTILVLAFVFFVSILAEIIGVATGKIFGIYAYGIGLGVKVFQVPLLIGLNWIILVYGSNAILAKITANRYLKVLGASALMVIYDLVLEIAAPIMNMWEFDPVRPPIDNYIGWFVLAILFNSLIEIFKVDTNNKPGKALFTVQLVFFVLIVLSNSILLK